MRTVESRRILTTFSPLVLPLLALYAFKTMPPGVVYGGAGPNDEAPAEIVAVTIQPPTAAQLRAAEWARSSRPAGIESPFHYPKPTDDTPPVAAGDTPEVEPVVLEPPPEVTIGGFMGAGARAMVIVNGDFRRKGDRVASGWTITEIDVVGQQVTVTHDDGRTHTFSSK
jgi:hypothetical protein